MVMMMMVVVVVIIIRIKKNKRVQAIYYICENGKNIKRTCKNMKSTQVDLYCTTRAEILYFSRSLRSKYGFGTLVAWDGSFGNQKSTDLEIYGKNMKKRLLTRIIKS